MDENLPEEDLIMKYLDGELPPADAASFESRLQHDTLLAEQLTRFRVSGEAVKYYGLQEKVAHTAKHFRAIKQDQQVKPARIFSIHRNLRYGLAVAGSVLLIFMVIRTSSVTPVSAEKIYEDSYVEYRISQSGSAGRSTSAIVNTWKEQDYQAVINYANEKLLNPSEQLLLGLSYLKEDRPADAVNSLKMVLRYKDPTYHPDAEFYLGLAYLKTREYKLALNWLTKIRNDKRHVYHQQVSQQTIEAVKRLTDQ